MSFSPQEARDGHGRWTAGQRQLARRGVPHSLVGHVRARVHAGRGSLGVAPEQSGVKGVFARDPARQFYPGTAARSGWPKGPAIVLDSPRVSNAGTSTHEAAHAIDAHHGISRSPDFRRAFGADRVRGAGGYWTENPGEALAEAVRAHLTPRDPDVRQLRSEMPHVMSIVGRKLIQMGVKLRKFNQDHGSDGRFTGPGTSHQPTGNPVGRPRVGTARTRLVEGEATGRQVSQVAGGSLGSVAGDYGGSMAGSALAPYAAEAGGALGSVLGPLGAAGGAAIGAAAAKYGVPILASTVGDYVGTKIATALYDLKAGMDGQPVGTKTAVGELTPRDKAGLAGSYLGGWGLYGALRLGARFIPGGNALSGAAKLLNSEDASLAASTAREVLPGALADPIGYAAGVKAYDAARGAPGGVREAARAAHGAQGDSPAPSGLAMRAARKAGKAGVRALTKSYVLRKFAAGGLYGSGDEAAGNPPKGYTGSWGSMVSAAPPHLFGPKAWAEVKSTPFGSYIMSRLKQVAQKMDDAAAQHGIDVTPMKPQELEQSAAAIGQVRQQQQAAQAQQAQHMQQAQQAQSPNGAFLGKSPNGVPPGKSPNGDAGPRDFGKAMALPFHAPDDAVAANAYRTSGPLSVAFLRSMQEADRRAKLLQMNNILAQPKVQNLARNPNEDEQAYRARMNALMQASVEATDRLRPQLWGTGPADGTNPKLLNGGQSTVARVRLRKRSAPAPAARAGEFDFEIKSEIIKDLAGVPLDKGLVYGFASVIEKDGEQVVDHQGDRISEDELLKAAHDYIANSRQGGVLHDQYGHKIGHVVESVVFTKDLQKALGIDLKKTAWLIGYQIVDPKVRLLVKSGVLKSFSIGGRGKRVPVDVAA
ncbi:MAG: hypothetical protein KGL39_03230 [Patescibacteria group bacterium]|nr:hypothetical protein [Patescibacteria group bacterium]